MQRIQEQGATPFQVGLLVKSGHRLPEEVLRGCQEHSNKELIEKLDTGYWDRAYKILVKMLRRGDLNKLGLERERSLVEALFKRRSPRKRYRLTG